MTHHQDTAADLILFNGRVTTLGMTYPEVSAVAVREGNFLVVGSDGQVLALRRPATRVIDPGGRRVIPGLDDTHLHMIRGGLNFNMELRWDGVPSLADALHLLQRRTQRHVRPAADRAERNRRIRAQE